VPIECVNSYHNEPPKRMSYQSLRFTTDEKVDLALAQEFLSGCDCTGVCHRFLVVSLVEENDICRQLCGPGTLRLPAADAGGPSRVRRRPDARLRAPTTAAHACRVGALRVQPHVRVQPALPEPRGAEPAHRLSPGVVYFSTIGSSTMLGFQIFKTAECGWGVRTLYDIPKVGLVYVQLLVPHLGKVGITV